MAGDLTSPCESTPADDERSLAGNDLQQSLVGSIEHLMTPKIVDIVLKRAVMMGGIGTDSMASKLAVDVVDYIWWVVDIADSWRNSGDKIWARGRAV